jgi:RimJ/RimL family protein N-acetyltransferase
VADIVVAAWRTSYRHIFCTQYIDGPAFAAARRRSWERLLRGRGSDPTPAVLVVADDGEVVGWASLEPVADEATNAAVVELRGFYIDPAQWGTNAAPTLHAAVLQHMATEGYGRGDLWALEQNLRAIRFYRRAGWTSTGGRRERDFGEAGKAIEIEMTRPLP